MTKVFKHFPKQSHSIPFYIPPNEKYGDQDVTSLFSSIAFDYRFSTVMEKVPLMESVIIRGTEILADDDFIENVRSQNFDLLVSAPFIFGAQGLAVRAGIKVLLMNQANLLPEVSAIHMGIPLAEAIVPGFTVSYGDKMPTFKQRFLNYLLVHAPEVMVNVEGGTLEKERAMFAKPPDNNFPELSDFFRTVPYMGLNGVMMLDFPRPISKDVFYLGNLENEEKTQVLPVEFSEILARKTVVMSFGSVAKSDTMPDFLKVMLQRKNCYLVGPATS